MIRALACACALAACAHAPRSTPSAPPLGIDPVIAARADGVVFRALGAGPDFVLHIYRDERIFLAWDFGAHQEVFPKPAPILPRWNGEIYETGNPRHTLRVEVRHTPCRDVNGQTLPADVTIVIDGERRRGCGFSL